jgi:hypothetical protein
MVDDRIICFDRESCLVKTSHVTVYEGDVTSWSSVLRLLVGLMVAALVNAAPRSSLNGSKAARGSLVA